MVPMISIKKCVTYKEMATLGAHIKKIRQETKSKHTNSFMFRPSSCSEPKKRFELETIMVCVKPVHPSEGGVLEEVNLILVGEKRKLATILSYPEVTDTIASTFL